MRQLPMSRSLMLLSLPMLLSACGTIGEKLAELQPPKTPQAFTATAAGPTSVELSWDETANTQTFSLERKTGSSAYARIATLDADELEYTDDKVSPKTGYSYRLTAENKRGTSDAATARVTTPDASAPTAPGADVNAYVATLPAWSEFSPEQPESEKAAGPSTVSSSEFQGATYDCTTTPMSLTRTPDQLVTFSPDASIFWPGVLLQGQGYKQGLGSLKELPIRQRAPLKLSIDLLGSDNTRTVERPDLASVNQAVGDLVQSAKDRSVPPGSSVSYRSTKTSSTEQASLKLGVSVRYLTSSLKTSLDISREVNQNTVTAFFIEKAFTVSVVPPQTPSGYFGSDFTQALLEEQQRLGNLGPNNIPVYVSNVVYGRVLMFSMTAQGSATDIAAAIDFSYKGAAGVDVDTQAKYKKILSSSTINVATVGGDTNNVRELIRTGELSEYFTQNADLATYRPISYEVRNLGDGSIAKVSETTNYNIRECTARPKDPVKVGEEVQLTLDRIDVMDAGDGGAENGEVYGELKLDGNTAWSANRDNHVSVGSGGVINMNGQSSLKKTANLGSNATFAITGYFKEADDGFRGGDDDLGSFDTNVNVAVPMSSGQYSTTLANSNGKMKLVYTVRRVADINKP